MSCLLGQDISSLLGQDMSCLLGQGISSLLGQDISCLLGQDVSSLLGQDVSCLLGQEVMLFTSIQIGLDRFYQFNRYRYWYFDIEQKSESVLVRIGRG